MTHSESDILIVGQGLAGSLLAWELERRGCRTIVVDADHQGSSSLAAAGMITPVTGKRVVLQENIAPLLTAAETLYAELQDQFAQPFLHQLPVLRLFVDARQQETFLQRRDDPSYSGFLGTQASGQDLAGLVAPYGGGWLQRTGYLDTRPLLEALGAWLRSHNRLVSSEFDSNELHMTTSNLRWRDHKFDRIVFCEGYRAIENTWFRHLPWAGAKGEILELRLKTASPLPDAIINWGNWLSPRKDGSYRLGATYSWSPLDQEPTQDARQQLLEDLERHVPGVETQVILHAVGVRPATRTRLPFLGTRTGEPRIHIFNGFGAKGGLLIPWHAALMADHLARGTPLPESVDVSRYG